VSRPLPRAPRSLAAKVAALAVTLLVAEKALSGDDAPMSPSPTSKQDSAAHGGRPANRLAAARSPYLLQHAHNPVDWYPWGDEAFAKAAAEDKPVFLSVGYSACHWCHVMERESFEDLEVAALLNARFVAVKVDREERPDVDEVYMRVTQMMTGSGGWPMSVFMTPAKRPFFAGTYFPKTPRYGTIGFLSLLGKIDEAWRTRRAEIDESAVEISRAAAEPGAEARMALPEGRTLSAAASLDALSRALAKRFDAREGGFGGAPKFPPHPALRLLVEERARVGDAALERALFTLEKIAQGGIHDHVGGGFARYSVDDAWHVPHFEKMLYDNAQLGRAYVGAWEATKRPLFKEAAVGIFEWALREMADPAGGFHSALDADSEGVEGKFYLWSPTETAAVLGAARAAAFDRAYDVTPEGNWEHGRSIPRTTHSKALGSAFAEERALLLREREKRVRPGLDDKVLTSWNGLMIGALARGGAVLGEPRYTEAAVRAARFITTTMKDGEGRLLRVFRRGEAGQRAFLEDHAFLADGLLDLQEATGDAAWLAAAEGVLDALLRGFQDPATGGLFSTAHDAEPLLFRSQEPFDGAVPNDGAVAVRALLRLARARGGAGERWLAAADRAIRAQGLAVEKAPAAVATLIGALCLREALPSSTGPGKGLPRDPGAAAPTAATPTATAGLTTATAADVSVSAWIEGGPLRTGAGATLRARVTLAPSIYVSAPLESVSVTSNLAIEAGTVQASAPESALLPYEDAPKALYRNGFELTAAITPRPGATAAKGVVRLALRYLACDEKSCRPARDLVVEVPVEVAP